MTLFKPHNIYPNTIYPELQGHDYLLLSQYFADTLAPGGKERLARDARDYQQMVATADPSMRKSATLLRRDQDEEQSQEMRDEIQSKFARISDRLPQEFIISNFDHLDDPLDLDLLVNVEEDEETQAEPEESQISQELLEVVHTTKKARQASAGRVERSQTRTPSPTPSRGPRVAATSPIIPSSSNDGMAKAPAQALARRTSQPEVNTTAESIPEASWLAGQVFCFDRNLRIDSGEEKSMREGIHKCGGATLVYNDCKTSIVTAISASTVVICDKRPSSIYNTVSNFDSSDLEVLLGL